jgi:carbon monoxide dehydrogenase subunit G
MTHSGIFQVACSASDVFRLLASPERFAPLLPDYESMAMLDATHFSLRTVIAIGEISGHAQLAMELKQAAPECVVEYVGEGVIAGGRLKFGIRFEIAAQEPSTEVSWRGEVTLDGMLTMLAGHLLETMGRKNFEAMAERVQQQLIEGSAPGQPDPDFEI